MPFKDTQEGQTHYYNDGCGEPEHNAMKKDCMCKELTCEKDCTRNHTHKTFYCEKCEPEQCKEVYGENSSDLNKDIKDRMFQCVVENYGEVNILEDTALITKEEAYKLWDSYFDKIKKAIRDDKGGDMVIWKDCTTNIDYQTEEKVIDHGECIYENGHIYKVTKTEIT